MVWFFPSFYPCAIYTVSKAVTGIETLELCLLPLKISRSHLFFFFFCVIKIRNLRARGRLYRHVNFGDPHFFLFQFHPRPSENESEIESEISGRPSRRHSRIIGVNGKRRFAPFVVVLIHPPLGVINDSPGGKFENVPKIIEKDWIE
jgi:hypothetical protein